MGFEKFNRDGKTVWLFMMEAPAYLLKVLANVGRDLRVRQFVCRLHFRDVSFVLRALNTFGEFPFRFAWSKNQDRVRIVHALEDLVVVVIQLVHRPMLASVFRYERFGAVRIRPSWNIRGLGGGVPVRVELPQFLPLIGDQHHDCLSMVDPDACLDCHESCLSD